MTETVLRHELRRGAYADSVILMQLQAGLAGLDGVADAAAVMATPTNLELLEANELLPAGLEAAAEDLLLVVRADSAAAAEAALEAVDGLLARRRESADGEYRPKSLDGAARLMPESRWVLVSVPGRYAAAVAREALEGGRHVFLYSDNVAVEDEVELKTAAGERGLLVLGPDCGTTILAGAGLGFANRVRRGGVGLVGASGTGIQAISSRVDALGGGVSHAIGTGGRDLSAAVGGRTALQGLDLLARDPETRVIVLVSKPPAREVAAKLLAAARGCGKPVVVCFLGGAAPARRLGPLAFATGLDDAAELAVELLAERPPAGDAAGEDLAHGRAGAGLAPAATPGRAGASPAPTAPAEEPRAGHLRGLFAGGTLAQEVLQGVAPFLAPLSSNLKAPGVEPPEDPARSRGHAILDLGADEYTQGRLHPMLDPTLRIERLRQEAADPETALILVDLVLGDGAHADPAAELAQAIAASRRPGLEFAALVVGTGEDPQDAALQSEALAGAGAAVFSAVEPTVAHLLERLVAAPERPATPVPLDALAGPPAAINLGLEIFRDGLVATGGSALQVDWRPPAGGDARLAAILARLKG